MQFSKAHSRSSICEMLTRFGHGIDNQEKDMFCSKLIINHTPNENCNKNRINSEKIKTIREEAVDEIEMDRLKTCSSGKSYSHSSSSNSNNGSISRYRSLKDSFEDRQRRGKDHIQSMINVKINQDEADVGKVRGKQKRFSNSSSSTSSETGNGEAINVPVNFKDELEATVKIGLQKDKEKSFNYSHYSKPMKYIKASKVSKEEPDYENLRHQKGKNLREAKSVKFHDEY